MCGIAGFITVEAQTGNEPVLQRMTSAIAHRGPDDSRVYTDPHASLGHRRLSIIDLASGHQPMPNEDSSYWIVYNGEIFNHSDVRPELERAGHVYRTHCDTETIIHCHEQFGPEGLTRFRGMFAFALWNRNTRTLFCARDRLGIKPFYYYWDGKVFVFASEIKALLEHPAVPCRFNEAGLPEYLAFGYLSGENTLFSGIRKLMPGHHLTLNLNTPSPSLSIRQYWDAAPATAVEQKSDEAWIRECRQRLEETVQMRLMSDVPLGMFLSGGLDSSAIAALMRQMRTEPVKTFAVGYREAQYSELSYARQVAETIGTDHHEVVIGSEEFFGALPKLIWHEDEPVVWPSSISLYFVSQLAAKHVKVVLTGEGSDELFAGYSRYSHYIWNGNWNRRYGMVPAFLRRQVKNWIGATRLLSADTRRKLQHTFIGRDNSIEDLYLDNFYSAFSAAETQRLLGKNFASHASYNPYLEAWNRYPEASVLSRLLYADQKTYLVELLMKQDQMSMANSIESRVPFLDHTFVEFAARTPDHLKVRNGSGKYIVKKAVENLLPHDIVYRTKMGFPTPVRDWLSGPGAEPLLAHLRGGIVGQYLDQTEVNNLLERHRHGIEDGTDRIWRLLNLQIWGHLFFTGQRSKWLQPGYCMRPAA